jgi:hypothetical protein
VQDGGCGAVGAIKSVVEMMARARIFSLAVLKDEQIDCRIRDLLDIKKPARDVTHPYTYYVV